MREIHTEVTAQGQLSFLNNAPALTPSEYDWVMMRAAAQNMVDVVRFLNDKVTKNGRVDGAKAAAVSGHASSLKVFVDMLTTHPVALPLNETVAHGQTECFTLILPFVHPDDYPLAFRILLSRATAPQMDMVRTLAQHVDRHAELKAVLVQYGHLKGRIDADTMFENARAIVAQLDREEIEQKATDPNASHALGKNARKM